MNKRILCILGMIVLLIGVPKAVMADSILLGPHDFHPLSEDTDYVRSPLHIYLNPASTSYAFFAPVHLPHDAKITSVVVFYYDAHGSGDLYVSLEKINKYTQSETMMADWNSLGQTFSNQIHKISPITGGNKVDNGGYTYYVVAQFSDPSAETNVKLYAVKIIYTTT